MGKKCEGNEDFLKHFTATQDTLKPTCLEQSYEKTSDSALHGSSALAFPMVHCQYHSKGLGFLGRKGCNQFIS